MIRIGKWEISWRGETHRWAYEEEDHVWEFILKIEKVTPYEAKHRAMLAKRLDTTK